MFLIFQDAEVYFAVFCICPLPLQKVQGVE